MEGALGSNAPELLGAAIDGDEGRECFGPAPPAELRTGDDPLVLVEPVRDVRARLRRMGGQPGVEQLRAVRQRHLVERLLARAGDGESRRTVLRPGRRLRRRRLLRGCRDLRSRHGGGGGGGGGRGGRRCWGGGGGG